MKKQFIGLSGEVLWLDPQPGRFSLGHTEVLR
jgi:hypothetical protein